MRKDLLSADYLQADETTVPVQMGINEVATTKHIYGNTENREVKRFSSFVWGEDAKDRGSFLASGKVFYKPTGIKLMMAWAGRSLCKWGVGRLPDASLSMR